MILECTRRCEQPCADCAPAAAADRDLDRDLDLDLLRAILPALRPLGITTLELMGGEPILHPRFDELLDVLDRSELRIGVRSHGWRAAEYLERLAPVRDAIAYVLLPLRAHSAAAHDAASPVAGAFARSLDAIRTYRAAGYAVTVDHVVTQQTMGHLLALGELLADQAITLTLRAPVEPTAEPTATAWQAHPEAASILIPQIQALKHLLQERIVLEPSVGFNHLYNFCGNFTLMDRTVLRASGDVEFCRVCPAGDRSGVLGNLRDAPLSTILGRHPRRVGAIWSARLAAIASTPAGVANNCTFCRQTLRAGSPTTG